VGNGTLFLYKAPEDSYDLDIPPIAFEIETAALDKLKTAWRKQIDKKSNETRVAAKPAEAIGHSAGPPISTITTQRDTRTKEVM